MARRFVPGRLRGTGPAALIITAVCTLSLQYLPTASAMVQGEKPTGGQAAPVHVSVVVLDKDREPIRNLGKGNFRLFEDGKEVTIDTLEEVTGLAPKANSTDTEKTGKSGLFHGKVVLILFDDSHISGDQVKATRDSAEQYVKDHMGPQDLFAVASFGNAVNILQSYTRDAGKVVEAIHRTAGAAETQADISANPTSAASRNSNRIGQTTQTGSNTLSSYQTETYRAAPLLRALDSLNTTLDQIRGRKALLLYSADFSAGAAIQGDFTRTVKSARKAQVIYYIVDARGLNTLADGGGGQGAGPLSSTASAGNTRARSTGLDWNQFEKIPLENLLRPLAKETGGLAIYNTSNFNQRLDEADKEISNYYVLGFQPLNPKADGKFRELEVRTDVKGAVLKHPDGYYDSRLLDALAGTREEKALLTALASPDSATRIGVTLHAGYLYESPALVYVPVAAKIRAASIELRNKGGQLAGNLNIMGVALAEDGSVAARFSELQQILFDKTAGETFRQRNLVYRNAFKLAPGRYLLKMAVSDEQGKIGSAGQSLQIPPLPAAGLAASSLIVAEQVFQLPDLIQNVQAGMLEESDPLTFSGLQVTPIAGNQLPADAPMQVFFKLYNLHSAPQRQPLLATVQLLGEKGEERTIPPTPLNNNLFVTGKTEAMVGIPLRFEKAAPGRYRLVIVVSETASSQSVTLQTELEFR